jgi:hypothetical protein
MEVAIGPHNARPTWRVLRVKFDAEEPDHSARVSEALRTLFAPTKDSASPSSVPAWQCSYDRAGSYRSDPA